MQKLTCFKAYDIRMQIGHRIKWRHCLSWKKVALYGMFVGSGKQVVAPKVMYAWTSESLKLALANGLQDAGVNVIDIGMTGTEEIY